MSRILVIDCETTGFDPVTCGVVEYAHAVADTETGRVSRHWSVLCHPGEGRLPIPPEARAVHHIRDEEVRDQHEVGSYVGRFDFANIDVFCAHNAPFDRGHLAGTYPFASEPAVPWICTYRCAKHLWPDAPRYSNQVLRYWRGVEPAWPAWSDKSGPRTDCPPGPAWVPHRALYDVCTTAALLLDLLDSAEEPYTGHSQEGAYEWAEEQRILAPGRLVHLTTQPVLLRTCTFGKHRGVPWADVPRDYLQWCLRQPDWGEDELHTIRYYLGGGD